MKIEIIKTPKNCDSDDIIFHGEYRGFGFKSKEDGRLCINKCPNCGQENYAMAVSSGGCAWCGFKADEKETSKI